MPDQTQALVQERKNTHGPYAEQTMYTEMLADVVRGSHSWGHMNPQQRHAAYMICVKLGRICAGDPGYVDHWADIAGYAHLASGGDQ